MLQPHHYTHDMRGEPRITLEGWQFFDEMDVHNWLFFSNNDQAIMHNSCDRWCDIQLSTPFACGIDDNQFELDVPF